MACGVMVIAHRDVIAAIVEEIRRFSTKRTGRYHADRRKMPLNRIDLLMRRHDLRLRRATGDTLSRLVDLFCIRIELRAQW